MRTARDCQFIAASVITNNDTEFALLFGLLCGAYLKHPDALFWDTLVRFLEKRLEAHASSISRPSG